MLFNLTIRKVSLRCFLAMLLMPFCISVTLADPAAQQSGVAPDGAQIFVERCVLCHGNYGAGDGFMPLVIKGYPNTNLLQTKSSGHFSELQTQVMWGGAYGTMNDKSPPWVDELSTLEMKAVSQFVDKLQTNTDQAWRSSLDKYYSVHKPTSIETGRLVYQTRCAACHGASGQGDGPMSAIVKTPPPFNLVRSRLSKEELKKIVSQGGSALGRSVQMPAWQSELTNVQIDSVVEYMLLFRE